MTDLPALFAAFNARDWDRFDGVVDDLFSPDFLLHLPKRGARPLDRDAYRRAVREEVDTHPDLRYVVGDTLVGPDRLALTLERRFTLAGRSTIVPVCLVARLVEGRIATITEYAGAPHRA